MKKKSTASTARVGAKKISTNRLAATLNVKPQTPRAALCRVGHYLGMRPVKLPNGRLLWDEDEAERLASGEVTA